MPLAKDNYLLGQLELDIAGMWPEARDLTQIKVTFEMDEYFKLSVTATEMNSNGEEVKQPANETSMSFFRYPTNEQIEDSLAKYERLYSSEL